MKRPYLTSFERFSIYCGKGSFILLRFRYKQLERKLLKTKLFKFIFDRPNLTEAQRKKKSRYIIAIMIVLVVYWFLMIIVTLIKD